MGQLRAAFKRRDGTSPDTRAAPGGQLLRHTAGLNCAVCTFKREGEVIRIVNPTPGSLTVKKSHADIDATRVTEGILGEVGRVGAKFQAMTFGDILLRR